MRILKLLGLFCTHIQSIYIKQVWKIGIASGKATEFGERDHTGALFLVFPDPEIKGARFTLPLIFGITTPAPLHRVVRQLSNNQNLGRLGEHWKVNQAGEDS